MGYFVLPNNESAPNLAETSAFVAVLEHKSFAQAAKQLGLSPARVSELLRKLEERLGVRLVERTTRSVAATTAGELLLARLRPVLDDYQGAFEALNEFRGRPAGTLRLTVAPLAAELVLAPVVARFLAQYPEISLEISADSARTDIVAGHFDAGIRRRSWLERDMIGVSISDRDETEFVIAVAPAYLAQRGKPKTPRDLENHDCIRLRLASGGLLPWRFRVKRRSFEVQVRDRLIVNTTALGIRAALDSAGLVYLPRALMASEIGAGRLVTVLDGCTLPGDSFYLYYPSRRQTRPALTALVDFLRNTRRRSARSDQLRSATRA